MNASDTTRSGVNSAPYPHPAVSWYSTVLLALLYWLSILDRTVISLLVDPIKVDLGISDVQFGMLHGLAFAVTFSLFGLAAGTLADRLSRRTIIFASVTIWSLATAACGLAKDFTQLLLARVGVGAGEAGLNPCASSMITDLFPPSRLTMALAVYSMGASVGAGCAFFFGGLLVEAVSVADTFRLPLLGEVSPWQAVFIIIGVPGVAIAFLSFTMPEPVRRGLRDESKAQEPLLQSMFRGYPDLLAFIRTRRRFFIHHYVGFGLAAATFTGGSAWYAAHLAREFGWTGSQIGLGLGISLVLGGIIGKIICGYAVGVLYRRGHKDAQFLWYGSCLLVATPIGVLAATSSDPIVFLTALGVFIVLLSPMTAVYIASLNLVTPNELRGAGVAFYSATIGLLALSLGPILIAACSDYLYGGDAIGKGLATVYGVCCPLAAIALFTGRSAMREGVEAAEEWMGTD